MSDLPNNINEIITEIKRSMGEPNMRLLVEDLGRVDGLYKDQITKLEKVVSGKIYNRMKANCHGYFSWTENDPYYDENGELHENEATRCVPWDLMKDIYKAMLSEALAELDN